MPGAALIGGLASIAGSGISQMIAGNQADEAYNRQKELMALQNQYAVENWARENRYNTPAEQRKRLEAAGLNPDLMYGSGGVGNLAGSIDSPSAPSAPMAPTMDFSKAVDSAVSAAVGVAQAKKAGSETIKQDIENKYLSQTIEAALDNTKAMTDLSKEQRAEVAMKCQNLSAEWNLMQAQIDNAKKEGNLLDKQVKTFDRRMNAEIDYMIAQSDMTKLEKTILSENKDNLIKLCKGQADLASTTAELASKYGDAQAIVGMLTQVVGAATDLLGAFMPKKAVQTVIKNFMPKQ